MSDEVFLRLAKRWEEKGGDERLECATNLRNLVAYINDENALTSIIEAKQVFVGEQAVIDNLKRLRLDT